MPPPVNIEVGAAGVAASRNASPSDPGTPKNASLIRPTLPLSSAPSSAAAATPSVETPRARRCTGANDEAAEPGCPEGDHADSVESEAICIGAPTDVAGRGTSGDRAAGELPSTPGRAAGVGSVSIPRAIDATRVLDAVCR